MHENKPLFTGFLGKLRLNNVHQLETIIAKSKNIMSFLSLCVVCAIHACVSYLRIIFKTCNVGNVCKNLKLLL